MASYELLVGCFRKREDWSISAIIEELEMYCDGEGDLLDSLFIEQFPMHSDNSDVVVKS